MKKRAGLAISLLFAGMGLSWGAPIDPPAAAELAPPPTPATTTSAPHYVVNEDGDQVMLYDPYASGLDAWSQGRFWFQADYLMFWVKQPANNIPLLTTGPDFAEIPGLLGDPATQILYGRGSLNYGTFAGAQFALGAWLDQRQVWGAEVRILTLEQRSQADAIRSDELGNPFLTRPFYNTEFDVQDVAVLAFPGLLRGEIHFTSQTQLWGGELNLLKNWVQGRSGRIDAIYGFRYLQLNERLRIDENYFPLVEEDNEIVFAGQGFEAPAAVYLFDQFKVRNQFYGAQIGARAELNFGSVSVDARAQIALGTTHSRLMVSGGSYLYDNESGEALASANGGILALPSNIGNRSKDSFAVVPSIALKAGWACTENVSLHVGYQFIYLSQVLRPQQQIDPYLDPRQVPTFVEFDPNFTANRPRPLLVGGDFWAQGLEFGVEIRY